MGPHAGPHSTDAVGWEITRREASEYLERLERQAVEQSGRPVDVHGSNKVTPPSASTARSRASFGADLAVLGSHGEGGVAAWNLGSTVQQVLAVARGSVLVARSSSPAAERRRCAAKPWILVPLDGSARTEKRVLPTATRIANAHGAELVLVHVVEEPQPTGVLRAAEDLELARELATRLESRAHRYLERIRDSLTREGLAVRALVVRHLDGRQALLEARRQSRAGRSRRPLGTRRATCNAARPFGSVTAHLLANSLVPLLVLQDLPEPELQRAGDVVDEEVAPPSSEARVTRRGPVDGRRTRRDNQRGRGGGRRRGCAGPRRDAERRSSAERRGP